MSAAPRRARSRGPAPCLLIVAAAGYGKTTEIEQAADGLDASCHGPASLGQWRLDGAPQALLSGSRHVVVDDFSALSADTRGAVSAALGSLPDDVSITITSRLPLDQSDRAALRRSFVEYGPEDLALDFRGVAAVLRDEHGVDDADLAAQVMHLTAGWPALVHFAGHELATVPSADDVVSALTTPGAPCMAWLHNEVLSALTKTDRAALGLLAELEPLADGLVEAVYELHPERPNESAGETLDRLRRLGLLFRSPGSDASQHRYSLIAILRAALLRSADRSERGPATTHTRQRVLRTAAEWYRTHDLPLSAALLLDRIGDRDGCARLIRDRGDEMLAAGGARAVVDLMSGPLAQRNDLRLDMVVADAMRMSGDVMAAHRAFVALLDATPTTRAETNGLAWRAASVHYLRGDYDSAVAVCDRAGVDARTSATADEARVLAVRSSAQLMLGKARQSKADAQGALVTALRLDDDHSLAYAHLASALTTAGARRANHLADALTAASRAGDVVAAARVLVNQADALLNEGDFSHALSVASQAVELADLGSPPGIVISALHNMGEAHLRLGQCEDARPYFARSVALCRRLGLGRTAGGLWGLAEVEWHLGRVDDAQAAYREVIDVARENNDHQVLVPALGRLARVLVECGAVPEGLAEAREASDEAIRLATAELLPSALVARGRVALRSGDPITAHGLAERATAQARGLRCASACAEALELTAAAVEDPSATRQALTKASNLWRRAGAEISQRRLAVLVGALPDADGAERAASRSAQRWLAATGIRLLEVADVLAHADSGEVQIKILGGFEVVVGGAPVPVPAWKSRQARSLLKILAGRRGRPMTRGHLCELLWPDDDPQKTPHRLSVLMSAVRNVLDPERALPPDHYIRADLVGVALDTSHARVDAERFLSDAALAAQLAREGEADRARAILADLEAAYRGEAFEEDPYDDWADALREETRAAWARSLRLSAELSSRCDDTDPAISCLVRLLAIDPYDEGAHKALVGQLVRSGRHGEARRAFDRWRDAMRGIQAPSPSETLLRSGLLIA